MKRRKLKTPYEKVIDYFNPFSHFGVTEKNAYFIQWVTIAVLLIFELLTLQIIRDLEESAVYLVIVAIALVTYISLRMGLLQGLICALITQIYVLFIFLSPFPHHYRFDDIRNVILMGLILFGLALCVGWLKDTIDVLFLKERSARQLAEDEKIRLSAILDQLPVGVLLVDKESRVLSGNKKVTEMLGREVKARFTLNDKSQSKIIPSSNVSQAHKDWPIIRAITKGEVVSAEEMAYMHENGQEIFLRVNAAPIKNRNRKVVAAVSTFYDITREKELEQRKDDFISMASHELKTPLTSMKLYLDVLVKRIKQSNDTSSLKILSRIRDQSDRLQELVGDLLDVSRIQTGKMRFKKESFRLDNQIVDIIEGLQGTTQKHELVYVEKKPIMIKADRFRIYQVLTNLITNAIKYSPNEGKIYIYARKQNGKVIVSVKDNGIGIPKEKQKKIFDRLYQANDFDGKSYPGLGMGLYISKEIIRRHQGRIWVESDKGKGSEFFFSLPLQKSPES